MAIIEPAIVVLRYGTKMVHGRFESITSYRTEGTRLLIIHFLAAQLAMLPIFVALLLLAALILKLGLNGGFVRGGITILQNGVPATDEAWMGTPVHGKDGERLETMLAGQKYWHSSITHTFMEWGRKTRERLEFTNFSGFF